MEAWGNTSIWYRPLCCGMISAACPKPRSSSAWENAFVLPANGRPRLAGWQFSPYFRYAALSNRSPGRWPVALRIMVVGVNGNHHRSIPLLTGNPRQHFGMVHARLSARSRSEPPRNSSAARPVAPFTHPRSIPRNIIGIKRGGIAPWGAARLFLPCQSPP
jgi:hypothetical protein